jgi:hypothetical protein
MFNLLPDEDREAIGREYRRRINVLILTFCFFALITSLVLMLPSFYIVFNGHKSALLELEELKAKSESTDYDAFSQEVRLAKNSISSIRNNIPQREKGVAVTIKEIVEMKPNGISLSVFNWEHVSDDSVKIIVNGRTENVCRLFARKQAFFER